VDARVPLGLDDKTPGRLVGVVSERPTLDLGAVGSSPALGVERTEQIRGRSPDTPPVGSPWQRERLWTGTLVALGCVPASGVFRACDAVVSRGGSPTLCPRGRHPHQPPGALAPAGVGCEVAAQWLPFAAP